MRYLFIFLIPFSLNTLNAQDKNKLKDMFTVAGYIKLIPSISFTNGDDLLTNNLIHNRINLKGYLSAHWTLKLEVRNRVYYGESVGLNPNFAIDLEQDSGLVDLSLNWLNKSKIVGNSVLDRAQINYTKGKWDITLGRQRINWGISLLWNTNDLFNAYNFVDFDYTERPGSDALRIQYYATDISSFELAFKPGVNKDEHVLAALYKVNKWDYDLQFIGANYNKDIALGLGWAGNVKNMGFKGEMTYFIPKDSQNSKEVYTSSIGFDYGFKNGVYFNIGALYNSNGIKDVSTGNLQGFTNASLSAKNLMPSKFSFFTQMSKAFNPIISGNISLIYGSKLNFIFLMPSLAYAIKNNWDIDLTSQILLAPKTKGYGNYGNSLFLRLTYSY